MDRLTAEQRSANMSKVRSKNTKPELLVRSMLHGLGFRFRLHRGDLPGKPDMVLPKYRSVIFVHGCFWHRHEGCGKATTPGSNVEFWQEKFRRNVARDREVRAQLEAAGWRVLVVWECELKDREALRVRLTAFLRGGVSPAAYPVSEGVPEESLPLAAEEPGSYGETAGPA